MEMTFLNNFYTILRTYLFGNEAIIGAIVPQSTLQSTTAKVLGTLKDINGNDLSELNYTYVSTSGSISGYMTNRFGYFRNNNASDWGATTYFGVGSSRADISMSAHELSAPITTDISIARMAATNSSGIMCNVTVRNSGNSAITISEIGLYDLVYISMYSSSSGTASRRVLVARAVLDNDVVIPSKESKTFDVSLSLALPTI